MMTLGDAPCARPLLSLLPVLTLSSSGLSRALRSDGRGVGAGVVGRGDGAVVGARVGARVGVSVGFCVGGSVGFRVGAGGGFCVGADDGAWEIVGSGVGQGPSWKVTPQLLFAQRVSLENQLFLFSTSLERHHPRFWLNFTASLNMELASFKDEVSHLLMSWSKEDVLS